MIDNPIKLYLIAHGAIGKDGEAHNVAMAKIPARSNIEALETFAKLYPQRERTTGANPVGETA